MTIRRKYTTEFELEIVKDYIDGFLTKKQIREKYRIYPNTFCNILKKHNIINNPRRPIESPNKKYYYDTNFFKIIDTEEKAYFLGLLMADGFVSNKYQNKVLGLSMTDMDCIEKFKTAIKSNSPITKLLPKNRKPLHRFLIYSKEIVEDISKYGIIGNKVYRTYIPNIDSTLIRHFIRGYFDGDGCIYVSKKMNNGSCTCSITSSSVLVLKQIEKLLLDLNIINNNINHIKKYKNSYQTFYIYNKTDTSKFLDFIYKNSTVYMQRKYNKYLKVKSI